jgi:hypothetical protein
VNLYVVKRRSSKKIIAIVWERSADDARRKVRTVFRFRYCRLIVEAANR